MEREELERMLSKELDGELTPEERERLKAEIASDPDAERLASSWRRSEKVLAGYISTLDGPSAEARARILAEAAHGDGGRRSTPFSWRVAAVAAGLLVSLGAGFGVGAAVFARRGGPAAESPRGGARVNIVALRTALRETQELMPERVSWAALCEGRLTLGTVPLPLPGAGRFHFVTFFIERSDRPRPMVCQIAVLDGEEARVAWESDGEWSILCRPVDAGGTVRLSTRVSYRPDGSPRGVALVAEPTVSGEGRLPLVSSRVGGVAFNVSVVIARATGARVTGGASL